MFCHQREKDWSPSFHLFLLLPHCVKTAKSQRGEGPICANNTNTRKSIKWFIAVKAKETVDEMMYMGVTHPCMCVNACQFALL